MTPGAGCWCEGEAVLPLSNVFKSSCFSSFDYMLVLFNLMIDFKSNFLPTAGESEANLFILINTCNFVFSSLYKTSYEARLKECWASQRLIRHVTFSEDFWNFPRQISIKTTTIFHERLDRDN